MKRKAHFPGTLAIQANLEKYGSKRKGRNFSMK